MADGGLQFDFNAELHQYVVDNQLQPHVTGILEQYGLIDYSGIPEFTLKRKQVIGTLVHEATAYMDQDGMDMDLAIDLVLGQHGEDCDFYEIGPDHAKVYCIGYKRFLAESGCQILPGMIEHRWVATVNGMRYGMTIDRGVILNKLHTILDFKCCYAKEKSWPIQLAGYGLGTPRPEQVFRWERAVLWLKPDSSYALLPGGRNFTDRVIERRDEETFLAALRIAWWKREELGHY